ncbi:MULTISPECIES: thiolase C-terminal domain-containing protein [Mycobacterium]|uniref:thiolase C-terminal domain-containing protein n=1 Tax=Mycobacterium TaxID=1763 RepID=UPI001EF0F19B|nr:MULTISPECIES: transporter [Mycobacterium]BDB44079.1 thiolase [Mycobacterium kiyosense]BDE15615.1 thiolase [Mycobacterium sp. 20KCMC460]GLD04088.1 thiolase [Mycobacterium kiyosense]GLD10430.1 thiolase [Mycobacterium kiyosense]
MSGFRGSTAVVGVGSTDYYKRGTSPLSSAQLVLQAILRACDDAGADPRAVDGFVSYAGDSSEGLAIGAALGVHEVRWSTQVWGGGGGAVAAAVNCAAAAVHSGQASCVAVYRGLSEATDGRGAYNKGHMGHLYAAHGMMAPAQVCAMRTQRMLEVDGVPPSTMEAIALAGYHHAQNNPSAVAYGQPLDHDRYRGARLISEPLRLFDCSRENDGATAVLVVSAERVGDYRGTPAYILSGVQGAAAGWTESVENESNYTSAGFHPALVKRLWEGAQLTANDVDVAQVYENFTGPAVASMIDHGLCPPGPAAGEVLTVDNLTVQRGHLPINTAGGNIAEGFVHGIGLVAEAVRQIRGGSPNPVVDADVSLLIGGPMAPLVSSTVFGSAATI